jgi:hypothetical protein
MMKSILVCLCAVLLLSGCSDTPEEKAQYAKEKAERIVLIDSYNEKSLANPVVVGQTPSGAVVSRSHVKYVCDDCNGRYPDDHYIYMVNGVTSDNYEYRSGKTRTDKVDVVWNEEPLSAQEIEERARKEFEEREQKKAKVDKDLKELARLKKEYPDQ